MEGHASEQRRGGPAKFCTLDGFVLRRTGGYNIYEIALAGMIDSRSAKAQYSANASSG
jgi:hypothetical protein